MKVAEREQLAEELGYEACLAFTAFCAERCFAEARRHSRARRELQDRGELVEAAGWLWDRAGGGETCEPQQIRALYAKIIRLEVASERGEGTRYRADVVLVKSIIPLVKGLALLLDPSADERITTLPLDGSKGKLVSRAAYVAGACEGPYQAAARVYVSGVAAGKAEIAICEAALTKLAASRASRFGRDFFDDVGDWPRTAVSPKYAGPGIAGSNDDEDDG
jgi:hypothetical protein